MDAQKLLDENKSIEQRMSAEFSRKIGDLARRERNQFNIAKKASNTIALIDEKVDLEFELLELKNELYNIQRRK